MSAKGLYEKLIKYKDNGKYPFHMPGHKRNERLFQKNSVFTCEDLSDEIILNQINKWEIDPYEIDITEISDFDNLHHPEGIIKSSMDNAAKFFGTDNTWFLVNGSSCGLLAAINAVTDIGDNILIGRNCHKAVYNAIELRNLKARYVYPHIIKEYGINGGYEPEEIEDTFKVAEIRGEKIKAVVITSPTYEGVVSDIKSIAEIVHKHDSILIVDEAHGAHLGIHENLPEPAYKLGADIVIESAHKTLPAMTQTAFLHLCENRVDIKKVHDCLAIYQSSSPSYVLMASLDKCIRELQTNGKEKLDQLLITLEVFYQKVNKLKNIKVPSKELIGSNGVFDFDLCKLIIFAYADKINGKILEETLREKYGFEMEMTSAKYVLGMTTMCDDMKQILRLADELEEIDKEVEQIKDKKIRDKINKKSNKEKQRNQEDIKVNEIMNGKTIDISKKYKGHEKENFAKMSIYEAKKKESEEILFKEAENKISAEYVYVYPPEIPLIVPGEVISKKCIENIQLYREIKLNVKGIEEGKIKVIAE